MLMHVFLGGAAGCRLEEDENEVVEDNVRAVSALRSVVGLAVVLVVFIAVVESVFTNELTAAASAIGGVGVVSTIVEVMTIFEKYSQRSEPFHLPNQGEKGENVSLAISSLLFHYKHLEGTNLKLRPGISASSTLGKYRYSIFPSIAYGKSSIPPACL